MQRPERMPMRLAQWSVFLAGWVGLMVALGHHVRRPGSHGFFRFFAFLALLGLAVWNAPDWFVDPLAPHQLASWALLAASAALAWTAGRTLRRHGRPTGGIEPTTALVTSGIYRRIRHPLYASLLLLAAGAWLKHVTWVSLGLVVATWAAVIATAQAEEAELRAQFGDAYAAYSRRTRRFLPGIW